MVFTVSVPGVPGVAVAEPQVGGSTAPVGAEETVQLRVTVPLKPPAAVTVTVVVAEPPGELIVSEVGAAESENDGEEVEGCVYLTT